VRLGPLARVQAQVLARAIRAAERAIAEGGRSATGLLEIVRKAIAEASLASIDYAELRDPVTLAEAPETLVGPTLLALAVDFVPDSDGMGAPVRLIDNCVLLQPDR
jgi:pantothenate synthetase